MEQRISLITLGVADLRRAMDFYGRLGWEGSSPDGEVAFYQAGGMILGLWTAPCCRPTAASWTPAVTAA
jgi:hypothetical protein